MREREKERKREREKQCSYGYFYLSEGVPVEPAVGVRAVDAPGVLALGQLAALRAVVPRAVPLA